MSFSLSCLCDNSKCQVVLKRGTNVKKIHSELPCKSLSNRRKTLAVSTQLKRVAKRKPEENSEFFSGFLFATA